MRVKSHIVALCVTTMMAPTAAYAQTAPGAEMNSESSGIADIVVTAQRRSESSQRAAIPISVLPAEALVAVTQAQQLTKLAPALQFGSAGGTTPTLFVRGIGTVAGNPYTDSAVAVNYDGVYLGRPSSTNGLFYDLDRVEVLKGPQGTLYGRNATGGALNVIPAKPVLGEASFHATGSYGNYDAANMQLAVNLPISDTIAVRAAGVAYTHDGYMSDGTYDEVGGGGRLQVLIDPNKGWDLRLSADYFSVGGTGGAATMIGMLQQGQIIRTDFGRNVGLLDPRTAAFLSTQAYVGSAGAFLGPWLPKLGAHNEYYGMHAEFNADLGFGKLTLLPAWRRSNRDERSNPGVFDINNIEKDDQISLEARLSGKIGPVDWLVGGYYFDEDVDASFIVNSRFQGGVQDLKAKNRSYAGFGRLVWNISDRFRLTGAGRYTQDKKRFDGIANSVNAVCLAPGVAACDAGPRLPVTFTSLPDAMAQIGYVPGVMPPFGSIYESATGNPLLYLPNTTVVNGSLSPSKFTYRAAAEFDVAPQSLLYASIETGYRSGGFSFSSRSPTFAPETITAYTIGSKNRFLDNRLQVNVEAFLWKYRNQQTPHFGRGIQNEVEYVTENIGRSTNKGVELEIVAKPVSNTLLRADIQYLDAKYNDFTYNEADFSIEAQLPPGTVPPVTGCPARFVAGAGGAVGSWRVDCSGKTPLRSPKWTINLGARQTFPVSDSFDIVADVDTHYQSKTIVMFERLAGLEQAAYWQTNAGLTLNFKNAGVSVTGFVNNIENKRIMTAASYNAIGGLLSAVVGPPRTYGLRVTVSR